MIYGIADIDAPVTGPPDAAYTTSAVHFNGSTWLTRGAALTGWGTPTKFTFAMWTKLSVCNDGPFSDTNNFTTGTTTNAGLDYLSVMVNGNYFDSAGPIAGGGTNPNATPIESAGWLGWMVSSDPAIPSANIYVGDVRVVDDNNLDLSTTGSISAGSNFWFGQDGFGLKITGDVADFRLWLGTAMDFTVQGNRRYFVRANGKPANPSYALALLGTPIIQFIGNSTAFPVNGGSGGSFTVTGSLSNAGTSPTD